MDQFDEPKKINQNVLKALLFLQSKNVGFTSADEIIKQVEKQMRSSNDPPHSVELIQESLSNLTNMGVLALTGSSEYALRYSIDASTDYIDIPKSGPKRKSKIPSRNLVARVRPRMGTTRKPYRTKVSKANKIRHKGKKAQRNILKKRTVKSSVRGKIARDRKAKMNGKKNCPKYVMCSECSLALKDFSVAFQSVKPKRGADFTKAQFSIGITSTES